MIISTGSPGLSPTSGRPQARQAETGETGQCSAPTNSLPLSATVTAGPMIRHLLGTLALFTVSIASMLCRNTPQRLEAISRQQSYRPEHRLSGLAPWLSSGAWLGTFARAAHHLDLRLPRWCMRRSAPANHKPHSPISEHLGGELRHNHTPALDGLGCAHAGSGTASGQAAQPSAAYLTCLELAHLCCPWQPSSCHAALHSRHCEHPRGTGTGCRHDSTAPQETGDHCADYTALSVS